MKEQKILINSLLKCYVKDQKILKKDEDVYDDKEIQFYYVLKFEKDKTIIMNKNGDLYVCDTEKIILIPKQYVTDIDDNKSILSL